MTMGSLPVGLEFISKTSNVSRDRTQIAIVFNAKVCEERGV